ncbi:hypothetical protein [Blastochloris sulfoviridis]|uniref:Uncharacterized protein n=1 Tax=Blastochloris sulfoviridis TaxID=50712 RepID=A0A5M6HQS9_9HYPH|nr:hypothetical protein [Blastochloris sulfoviridis]KAA5598225.1 hypothetical protein F1193_13640 [Blastochloris sulfoviridis]
MTDIFIAATSSLIMALAVSRPHEPVRLPIQADLVSFCPRAGQAAFLVVAADAVTRSAPRTVAAADAADLARAVGLLGLPDRPFYTIALASTPSRPPGPRCLREFQRDLVDRHNRDVIEPDAPPDARMIFTVTPVAVSLDFGE